MTSEHITRRLTIKPDTNVGTLIQWLGKLPSTARVDVNKTQSYGPLDSGETSITVSWNEDVTEGYVIDARPHSRACGPRKHDHGRDCHSNCPTCHGRGDFNA